MFDRLNIMALALALVIAGIAEEGAAQTSLKSAQPHADTATSSDKTDSPRQLPQPAAKDIPSDQQSETSSTSPVSDSELVSYIENSLKRDPTLSGANLHVAVSEDRVELSGNVAKARDKQTAGRLAQSFAGNKKLLNQITIGAPATSQTPAGDRTSPKASPEKRRPTPSLTAQPNQAPPLR